VSALTRFLHVAEDLDIAGLTWLPEIGDEVADRKRKESISILVDPGGMTPSELRSTYLWLPTVEQLVTQFEARQAILFHAGLEFTEQAYCYKTVLQTHVGPIEATADSLRLALGLALRELLLGDRSEVVN
jgi:hypothetical protein